ncbi:predicted flavoprotein [Hahella chejuensis KCTC 2396]|uniref:Predicted flavoprotein n=1 Tax=Hahella chejuensis (strain KCTC 2396) TaxID=349521 RepID=Q2SM21_HAHCH|nr:NAD(P)H-dependent oxidoreductase [Hahella chejuensis]ABC28303.1 predicted flavoprotein [Hahella chejuensis KCTC 2396]
MGNDINVALIYGSTREGRFCDKVARWAGGRILNYQGLSLDMIDPAELALPPYHQRERPPAVEALCRRVGQADAFVIVTPEYNHGYPAPLKFVIDSVNSEWRAKPVAFVSYGGISGGLRAVEQLRLVFAELHAVTVRDTVSFASAWEQFDENGELLAPARAQKSMDIMLDRLVWWAQALRGARQTTPYDSRQAA